MNVGTQAKLLRILEGHPFERVGGSTPIRVDVRVVAATNQPLEQAVHDGTFRRDLFFRLQVVEIRVPPLRERRDDIPLLAEHFLQALRARDGPQDPRLHAGGACRRWRSTTGPATSASCATSSSAPWPWPTGRCSTPPTSGCRRWTLATRAEDRRAPPTSRCRLEEIEKQPHPAHAATHRLEQEPGRRDPGHRALDAGSQDQGVRFEAVRSAAAAAGSRRPGWGARPRR